MTIKSADTNEVKDFFKKLYLPKPDSHKGQNGKLLLIGGSSLFHAASIWGALVASRFADMVHYASTEENNEIITSLKKKFLNGIVISQSAISLYAKEDDVLLIGLGMMREGPEGEYTKKLVDSLVHEFPDKRFVFDAGALQTMDPSLLLQLKTKAIVTPHQKEFEMLFKQKIDNLSIEKKQKMVQETAKKYNCIILLKAIVDIVSDGNETIVIEGGNPGLTKGGTGDVLASLTASFYLKNGALDSAVLASILLKRAADSLLLTHRYWYNIDDLITQIPQELSLLV